MRSALRTTGVATPALVVVALAWLRFEQPVAPLWRAVALALLALAVATPQRRSLRLLGGLIATVVAAWIAFGVDLLPWRAAATLSTIGTIFGNGFPDFYDTHLPFDPRVHAAMGHLVLAAIFGFSLVAVLLAAERKPVGTACAILLGAGWPATLLGPSNAVAMGAAILGAALVVLAGLGSRRPPVLAIPAVAIVAAGAVAVGSATASRHGLVHWQSWNLTGASANQVGVHFVWDVQYGGLTWPAHPTAVLDVRSDQRPAYLRAAVLDDFIGDRWSIGLPRPADYFEPRAALRPRNQTKQFVTVDGLSDTHLVGGSIPIRFAPEGGARLEVADGGFASSGEILPRSFHYTVWSYDPHATSAELRHSGLHYPATLTNATDGLLDVGSGVTVPPFGARDRIGRVESLIALNADLYAYRPLERLAEEVAGRASTPYDAVARLESWFVASGRFSYSNHPAVISPPLVGFVSQTRGGYCQYFAGAMTLMLRYLGIPSRVAVGFAGGTRSASRHAWVYTDRDAHAWVEVWFKGYGWLPVDPTPPTPGSTRIPTLPGSSTGTGGLPARLTVHGIAGSGGTSAIAAKLGRQNGLGPHHGVASHGSPLKATGGGVRGRALPVLLLLLALAVAGGAIVTAKAGFRLHRRARRDPRGIAAACREEIASFLADQRFDVPQSATLRELGELVQAEFGAKPDRFVTAATAARFAPDKEAAAAAVMARRELRLVLAEARRGLTWRDRIRGLFSLRSLARSGVSVDVSASLEGVGVGS